MTSNAKYNAEKNVYDAMIDSQRPVLVPEGNIWKVGCVNNVATLHYIDGTISDINWQDAVKILQRVDGMKPAYKRMKPPVVNELLPMFRECMETLINGEVEHCREFDVITVKYDYIDLMESGSIYVETPTGCSHYYKDSSGCLWLIKGYTDVAANNLELVQHYLKDIAVKKKDYKCIDLSIELEYRPQNLVTWEDDAAYLYEKTKEMGFIHNLNNPESEYACALTRARDGDIRVIEPNNKVTDMSLAEFGQWLYCNEHARGNWPTLNDYEFDSITRAEFDKLWTDIKKLAKLNSGYGRVLHASPDFSLTGIFNKYTKTRAIAYYRCGCMHEVYCPATGDTVYSNDEDAVHYIETALVNIHNSVKEELTSILSQAETKEEMVTILADYVLKTR